jgi:hypothetical protein
MPGPDGDDLAAIAEEFIALLRNLLSFVAAWFILCVASVRSYQFFAHRSIGLDPDAYIHRIGHSRRK